ncbi:MAG: TIGR03936 family radical SAM-associated protein [Anaerolineales bacterium]|jgi:radical SAM-linked protein
MRLRITFSKTDAMRYTSHLDLHRTWERTLRRAGLPLAYSQGYNPHPKINLASALPLGFTGQREIIDVWLEQALPFEEVRRALDKAAPPGIQVVALENIAERAPTLQKILLASEFIITLQDPVPDLEARVQALLAAESLPRERRGKAYDLRPLVEQLRCLPPDDEGQPRLFARLTAQEGATGRPEEVLREMGLAPENAGVERVQMVFANSE